VTAVAYEPPYTIGRGVGEPIAGGPRYITARGGNRTHLVRSGLRFPRHVAYRLWCGQSLFDTKGAVLSDEPPLPEVCGTCWGRAEGADGRDGLRFDPASRRVPRWCPSDRWAMWNVVDGRGPELPCPLCGATGVKLRGAYGWSGSPHLQRHLFVPDGAVEPCPHHRWACLRPRGEGLSCTWAGGW
jgi:hypothetical protein